MKNNKKYILLTIAFLGITNIHAQTNGHEINKVNIEVATINQVKNYRQVDCGYNKRLQTISRGAILIGNSAKNTLKKIDDWQIENKAGVRQISYYFKNRQLIKVEEIFYAFRIPENITIYNLEEYRSTMDTTTIINLAETAISFNGSYWFKKNKMIYMTTTGHNRFEDDTLDTESILLKEATEKKACLVSCSLAGKNH